MPAFKPGLVHCPVTPFKGDNSVDYNTYAKVLEFHLKNEADALAIPMPQGEDLSLTDAEQRTLLEFAIGYVKGRVPVIAHVSDPGTMIAVARAQHAESLGAAAIASHPPYFWHPKPAMVVEHLVEIGSATKLPFFIQARKAQERMATLHHTLKKAGFAGLKVALSAMGRECGSPRPPVDALGEVEGGALAERLHAMSFLQAEPRGW